MTERRVARLIALVLLLASIAGLAATFAGWMEPTDGTAWFATGLVVAVLTLHANRPMNHESPEPRLRAIARKGNDRGRNTRL